MLHTAALNSRQPTVRPHQQKCKHCACMHGTCLRHTGMNFWRYSLPRMTCGLLTASSCSIKQPPRLCWLGWVAPWWSAQHMQHQHNRLPTQILSQRLETPNAQPASTLCTPVLAVVLRPHAAASHTPGCPGAQAPTRGGACHCSRQVNKARTFFPTHNTTHSSAACQPQNWQHTTQYACRHQGALITFWHDSCDKSPHTCA